MTSVKLPDGSLKEFESAVSVKDVAKSIGSRLAKDALWGEIDLQPVELDYEIPSGEPVNLKIITKYMITKHVNSREYNSHIE